MIEITGFRHLFCTIPEGWKIKLIGAMVYAIHPDHAPRFAKPEDLPVPFDEWEKLTFQDTGGDDE